MEDEEEEEHVILTKATHVTIGSRVRAQEAIGETPMATTETVALPETQLNRSGTEAGQHALPAVKIRRRFLGGLRSYRFVTDVLSARSALGDCGGISKAQ